MKRPFKTIGFYLVMLCSFGVFAQSSIIEVDFCEEMNKEYALVKLSLIANGDTLRIPQVSENQFISPVDYYKLELDPKGSMVMLVENCQYIYKLKMPNDGLLHCNNFQMCITGHKSKGRYEYSLKFCGPLGQIDYADRIKK